MNIPINLHNVYNVYIYTDGQHLWDRYGILKYTGNLNILTLNWRENVQCYYCFTQSITHML